MLEWKQDLESFVKTVYKSWKSLSKSITQAIRFGTVVPPKQRSVLRHISLLNMFSCDLACRLRKTRSGRIAKPRRLSMISHQKLTNKESFLRDAAAMAVHCRRSAVYPVRSVESRFLSLFSFSASRRPFRLDN